jgi:tRNA(adenine34) deaminase
MNDHHHTLMLEALQQAQEAARRQEVPVGALVLSPEGEILAMDGNRTRETLDPTAHAEILVLRAASKKLNQWRLDGCTLYVTLEPCAMCAAAISLSKIKHVVYGAPDPKGGAIHHGPKFFEQSTCHHRPEITAPILEKDCGDILRNFFSARRGS